jgi:hypothetical protein
MAFAWEIVEQKLFAYSLQTKVTRQIKASKYYKMECSIPMDVGA